MNSQVLHVDGHLEMEIEMWLHSLNSSSDSRHPPPNSPSFEHSQWQQSPTSTMDSCFYEQFDYTPDALFVPSPSFDSPPQVYPGDETLQFYQEPDLTTYQPDPYPYEQTDHSMEHASSVPSSPSFQSPDHFSQIYAGDEMQPSANDTHMNSPTIPSSSPSTHEVQQPVSVEAQDSSPSPFAYSESQHSLSDGLIPPAVAVAPPATVPATSFTPPQLEHPLEALMRAEKWLDWVIWYMDTSARFLLTPEQREHLHEIKCIVFNRAAGLPYR